MKILRNGAFLLLIVFAIPLSINAISYANFASDYGFLKLKAAAIQTGYYLPAYYAHVLLAGLILPIGIFQVHPKWGQRWRTVHRLLGKTYVGGVLLFAAPGGLIMSLYINRGPWVLTSFLIQSALWFACTFVAYLHIRKGDIEAHRKWMLRSFALTMAAITLRIYVYISSSSFDLSQPEAYATIAWLSWVPNVLIVEWYLARSKFSNEALTSIT